MSKILAQDETSEEKQDGRIDKYGDRITKNEDWKRRLKDDFCTAFCVILEEMKMPVPLACFALILSFLQVAGICYNHDNHNANAESFHEDLQSVLNIIRIYPIIEAYNKPTLFYFVAYTLFFLQVLYLAFLFLVVEYDESGKRHYSAIVRIQCFLTPFLYWVLLGPSVEFFSSIIFCSSKSNSGFKCWTMQYDFVIISFCVLFLVFLANTFLITHLGNDNNPYNMDNVFSRYPWSFEKFFAVFRIFLFLFLQKLEGSVVGMAFDFIFFALSLSVLLLYQGTLMYYNKTVSNVFSTCLIGLFWISFNSLIVEIASFFDISYHGYVVTSLFGLVFAYKFACNLNTYLRESLIKGNRMAIIKEEKRVEAYLYNIIKFILEDEKETISEEDRILLHGYIYVHIMECTSPVCPMNNSGDYYESLTGNSAKKTGSIYKDYVRLKHVIQRIYFSKTQDNISANITALTGRVTISSLGLVLSMMYYQIYVLGNYIAAFFQIQRAETIDESLEGKCLGLRAKRIMEVKQDLRNSRKHVDGREKYESLDLRLVLEYDANLMDLKNKLSTASYHQKKLYDELMNPKPDLNKIHDYGLLIIDICEEIKASWDKLSSMGCEDSKAELLYGLYQGNIRCKQEEALEHFQIGKMYSERTVASNVRDFIKSKQTMFIEGSAVVEVEMISENANKIFKASNGVTQLFDYSSTDIIGKDVSILMPFFIADKHSSFIKSYVNSGRSTILNKPVSVPAMNKDEYIIGMYVYVRQYYHIVHGPMLIALLQPAPTEEATILTDFNGKVLSISHDITSLLHELTPISLREQDVYLFYICPLFYTEFIGKEYSSFEGSVSLTFCIPKNLSVISHEVSKKMKLFEKDGVIAEDVFKASFQDSLDFSDSLKVKKWCNISTQTTSNANLKFKVISFRKSTSGFENNSDSSARVDNMIDCDFDIKKAEDQNDHPKLRENSLRMSKIRNMLSSLVLPLFSQKQEISQEAVIEEAYKEEQNPGADLTNNESSASLIHDKAKHNMNMNMGSKKNEEIRKEGKAFIKKEINAVYNSTLANFHPSTIKYAHWGITLLFVIAISLTIAAYVFHIVCLKQIEEISKMSKWARGKYVLLVLDAVRTITLMDSKTLGTAFIDANARSNYNYATIGYDSSQKMNYRAWKLQEIITNVNILEDFKNKVQIQYIYSTVNKDVIIPSATPWIFRQGPTKVKSETDILHAVLAMFDNLAQRIYSKIIQNDTNIAGDIQMFVDNGFRGVISAIRYFPSVSIGASARYFDMEKLVAFVFLLIVASGTAVCLAVFLPLLYFISKEESEMYELFTKFSQASVKRCIDNCIKFNNLMNFREDCRERQNEEENERENDIENDNGSEDENEKMNHKGNESGNENFKELSQEELNQIDYRLRKKDKRKKNFEKYNAGVIGRISKMSVIFAVLVLYTLFCYYSPLSLFDTIEVNLKEIANIQVMCNYNLVFYTFTTELLATNGTAIIEGLPITAYMSLYRKILTDYHIGILEYHRNHSQHFSNYYKDTYNKLMFDSICQSEFVTDVSECGSIADSLVGKGLEFANGHYMEKISLMTTDFMAKPGPQRTLDYIKAQINSPAYIEFEKVNRKFFFPAYENIMDAGRQSISETVEGDFPKMTLVFVMFLVFSIFAYLVLWKIYREQIRKNLFASKRMYSFLPIDLIAANPSLAALIVKHARDLITDIKE